MNALPFDPSWLGDLSPLLALGIAKQHAPDLDPARRDEPLDAPEPESDWRYPLGAGLPRTYPRNHKES